MKEQEVKNISDWITENSNAHNISFGSQLFNGTKNGTISWEEANGDTVKTLMDKQVDISKLLSTYPDKIFPNANSKGFFLQLNEVWVNQAGISSQEKTARLITLTSAYKLRGYNSEVGFIEENHNDLAIQDALLSRPTAMPIDVYAEFLSSVSAAGQDAKILALKNCLALENHLNSELKKSDVKSEKNNKIVPAENNAGNQMEADEKKAELQKNLTEVQGAASNLRRSLLGLVIKQKQEEDKDAFQIQNSDSSEVKNDESFDMAQTFVPLHSIQKQPLEILQKSLNILKKVATNSRLRRAFTRDITKQILAEANKLDAISAVEGSQVKDTMVNMMCVLGAEDINYFNMLMSDVMQELQSQHNLSPYWTAGVSRNYNYVMYYPVGLFFYVLDCLSAAAEFLWVYAQKAGYGTYDYFAGNKNPRDIQFETYSSLKDTANAEMQTIVNAVNDPTNSQTHERKNSIESINAEFLQSSSGNDGLRVVIPDSTEIQLKKLLLDVLKSYRENPAIQLDALKEKIKEAQYLEAINVVLKAKVETLMKVESTKQFVVAAYDLLKDPVMNQGIDTALPSYANAAKAFNAAKVLSRE